MTGKLGTHSTGIAQMGVEIWAKRVSPRASVFGCGSERFAIERCAKLFTVPKVSYGLKLACIAPRAGTRIYGCGSEGFAVEGCTKLFRVLKVSDRLTLACTEPPARGPELPGPATQAM